MTTAAPHPHGTICVACGEAKLTGDEKPEHPIQAAIGSSWDVFTFCDDCNGWLSSEVDQAFLDEPFILELRSRYDVRDQRHSGRARRTGSPILRGHTEEGLYVVADEDGKPHLRGTRVEPGTEEGDFYVTAGSEEDKQRALEQLRIKTALEGKALEEGESIVVEERPRVTGRIEVRPWVLRRAAARIALAAGSVVYEEGWRVSNDAAQLRHWMRDKDALPWDHCPLEQVEGGPLEDLVEPPHHTMFFMQGEAATILVIILFGEMVFKLPVDSEGRPRPTTAWHLDPRRPRGDGRTTWTQLLASRCSGNFQTSSTRLRRPAESGLTGHRGSLV